MENLLLLLKLRAPKFVAIIYLNIVAVPKNEPPHDKTNGMCIQRRLRSAWASAQSDQSLRCSHEESLGP